MQHEPNHLVCLWLFLLSLLQLCSALQAEIEDYKRHSSSAAAGRSPGTRGVTSPAGAAGSRSEASAAAVAELEQQLASAQQQVVQLQQEVESSKQDADRTMTEMRAQRAEERNTLASAQAELSQVRGSCSAGMGCPNTGFCGACSEGPVK
jgi:TolA-binding protein